jgi:hypothetical protein
LATPMVSAADQREAEQFSDRCEFRAKTAGHSKSNRPPIPIAFGRLPRGLVSSCRIGCVYAPQVVAAVVDAG